MKGHGKERLDPITETEYGNPPNCPRTVFDDIVPDIVIKATKPVSKTILQCFVILLFRIVDRNKQ